MHLHSHSCSANMNPWWLPKTHSLKKHYSVALKGNCVSHLRLPTSAFKAEKFKLNRFLLKKKKRVEQFIERITRTLSILPCGMRECQRKIYVGR